MRRILAFVSASTVSSSKHSSTEILWKRMEDWSHPSLERYPRFAQPLEKIERSARIRKAAALMSDFFLDCTDYFFDAPKICGIAHNRRNQDSEAFRNLFLNHG